MVSGLIQQGSLRKNDRDQYQKGRAFTKMFFTNLIAYQKSEWTIVLCNNNDRNKVWLSGPNITC
jgi:hypothetical protein